MTEISTPLDNPVNGFKPSSWGAPVEDLVKEYEAYDREHTGKDIGWSQEDATQEGKTLVNKGRLNPLTGKEIPLSPKAQTISKFIPSEAFKRNFQEVKWDVEPVGTRL